MNQLQRVLAAASLCAGLVGPGLWAAPAAPVLPDPLDLKSAIRFAVENNFDIRQARERIRQQEGVVIEVSAREIPNVNASGGYQVNEKKISQTFPQGTSTWSLVVSASQSIYAGGGVRSAVRSARFTREAALLDFQAILNDALLNVRNSFYAVLLDREQIKVQESNLNLLQEQLKTATDRFNAGTVSSFEKLRADVAVANAKPPLITARNNYRLAIETLRQNLGFTTERGAPDRTPEIVGTLDYNAVSFDLASAFETARANRPDLLRLAKLTSSREENVTTANSTYYPNLSAVAGWELFRGPSSRFSDSNDGFYAGLQGQWAIFDGRATAGRSAQAKSLLRQAQLSLSQAELNVEVDVRRAYSSWQEAVELADASKRVVEEAEESVRLANARYNAGTGTQLDVLQVQVDLTTARTNQIQAYYNYNVAVAALRRAMGQADTVLASGAEK